MSNELKVRPFAAMETGARQFIMMAGMGFLGLVAGSMLTAALLSRLNDRLEGEPGFAMQLVLALVLPNLWALAVLPGLAWLTLRFLDLNAVTFAWVSSTTAFVFRTSLDFVTGGVEAVADNPIYVAVRLATLGVGITLTWLAGRRGQAYAQLQAAAAAKQAEKAKDQYSQFAEQAKALAERREAQPISAAARTEADPTAATGPTAGALEPSAAPAPAPPVDAPATAVPPVDASGGKPPAG
jgi:hypothetical protein